MSEHQLYELIAQYMQIQYPDVIYRFDLAADLKLTAGQARKHKMLHPKRGYPDLFIAEPIITSYRDENGMIKLTQTKNYSGIFIELKKDGTRLKKKNGEWASDHIAEQAEMLERLEFRGYRAMFAVGFDEAKKIIDLYFKGKL